MGLNLDIDPKVMSFDNYTFLFNGGSIYFKWFFNSLVLGLFTTVLTLFFSSMIGYGLAVYDFKGRNIIFVLVLIIMMVPLEVMMLPLFKLTVGLHLIDSYTGVILPFIVSPVAVFFFRQYALGLPRDLLDSARMDGCTEFGIFFRIMAPLMKTGFRCDDYPSVLKQLEQLLVAADCASVERNVYASNRAVQLAEPLWQQL